MAAPLTADQAGLMVCHACGLLNRPGVGQGLPDCPESHADTPSRAAHDQGHTSPGHELACVRCGAHLHRRKPESIVRTWAFTIAALILYIPANALPVMETGSMFGSQRDTIMSGVIYLWVSGSWPLAALIFFASVMVPLAKILAILFLVVSVQCRWTWAPLQRTQLYRVVEFVGRWSMIDIFVVAILAALVQFGGLASIRAGAGAIAFGAVVVLSMFAAEAFDPRLIWDPVRKENE